MEKYVQYLLADIQAAAENVPDLLIDPDEDDYEYLPVQEEAKYAPRRPLSERLGLPPDWFPPADRLTEAQMTLILVTLEECLEAFGFFVLFPEKVPVRRRYELLREKLPTEVPILRHNVWQIEFCQYNPDQCPFEADHCRCHDLELFFSDDQGADGVDWEDDWEEPGWTPEEEDWSTGEEEDVDPGLDISGYDMPELFFEGEQFELWSEDEFDHHGWTRPGPGHSPEDEDDWFPDEFAPPDADPEDEDGEE